MLLRDMSKKASAYVSVEEVSYGAQHRHGGSVKKPVTRAPLRVPYELLFREVVLVIVYSPLLRAPAGLEVPEAPVLGLGPSEAKTLIALCRVPPYGLPHDEVVGP